jgi:hypothetical protein
MPTARTPRHSGGFMLLNSLSETRATRAAIDQARASCAPGSEPPEQPAGETAQRQNLGGRIECIHGRE